MVSAIMLELHPCSLFLSLSQRVTAVHSVAEVAMVEVATVVDMVGEGDTTRILNPITSVVV